MILVTKDINLRIKAKSLNLLAEDYETGTSVSIEIGVTVRISTGVTAVSRGADVVSTGT